MLLFSVEGSNYPLKFRLRGNKLSRIKLQVHTSFHLTTTYAHSIRLCNASVERRETSYVPAGHHTHTRVTENCWLCQGAYESALTFAYLMVNNSSVTRSFWIIASYRMSRWLAGVNSIANYRFGCSSRSCLTGKQSVLATGISSSVPTIFSLNQTSIAKAPALDKFKRTFNPLLLTWRLYVNNS